MSGGSRLDARLQVIEPRHHVVESIHIPLNNLHGLKLLQPCALADLIFCIGIQISFQMADIGNVAHITDFISGIHEVAIDDIKAYESAAVADMYIIVNCGSTDIHADHALSDWLK